MPMQQQNSSFARRLGARVSAANAEHRDKPVDTGQRRLPAGIRNGLARLSTMYTKEQEAEDGAVPKGETFFRASAIVEAPESHEGEKVAGMVTSVIIPLCDTPAKGQRKEKSFSAHWFDFQNLFKLLGIDPPAEDQRTDPTGARTEAYYFAAMQALTDPKRPVYITFSTRGWTPPATALQPKPQEMVFETWHGRADNATVTTLTSAHDPAGGIRERPPSSSAERPPPATSSSPAGPGASNGGAGPSQSAGMSRPLFRTGSTGAPPPSQPATPPAGAGQQDGPPPFVEPPMGAVDPASLPNNGQIHDMSPDDAGPPDEPVDPDEVASLVETASSDPSGETPDGQEAAARLEELAWSVGWTRDQTGGAADWAAVGNMALNPPTQPSSVPPTEPSSVPPTEPGNGASNGLPAVGARFGFRKRTKDGAPMKNNKGEVFPPQEVEVVTVDLEAKTCTLKSVKDDRPVMDIRTRQPSVVKWEWLEQT